MQDYDAVKVKDVLNEAVNRHFTAQNRKDFVYRATLFRVRSFPFVGKWLGIAARSGDRHIKSSTIFSIDANNAEHNTGFAGECWRREDQNIISEKSLPEIAAQNPSAQDIAGYKTRGWLVDQEYNRMSVKSVTFLATCIRVNGKIWGVLVLDTTDPKTQPAENAQKLRKDHENALTYAAFVLGLLLR